MRAIAAFILVGACLSSGCQQAQRPTMKDVDKIQGKWLLVSGERHGNAFTPESIQNVTLTFDGNVLRTAKRDGVSEATYTLHPETNPEGIDLDMNGSLGLGIYKLEGETLTILHGEIEESRPANFEDIKRGTLTLLNLRKSDK
jgi:uncharacterized protein (TIGR03067 family)